MFGKELQNALLAELVMLKHALLEEMVKCSDVDTVCKRHVIACTIMFSYIILT